MTYIAGTKLGNYEVIGPLGAGGMGEVYRCRDLKLKRDVAVKVLPEAFALDPERIARFRREAEILASLNHPHIAAIYDLAESGKSSFLVLELVEGQTLADLLTSGPLKIDDALKIAVQICEALEAAHEKGIIHRDLKPANIKLTSNDAVKILDFGLAKIRETEYRTEGSSDSPTAASVPGTIMGTAAYMSPEQAKGRETGRASDVWSFGCVLFEMLSGKPAFPGESVTEILAGVLTAEPDWNLLSRKIPPGIRRLLRGCLQKEYGTRFRDCGDVRLLIEDAQDAELAEGEPAVHASRAGRLMVWIVAFAATLLIAATAILWPRRPAVALPELLLEITTPPTTDPVSLAISPDGQKIVFVATSDGRPRLWLRSLNSADAAPIAGTDFALYPFWSPDSRSIGFFAEGKLKRIDIEGGAPQTLANATNSRGGTWNRDGVIVFAPSGGQALLRTSVTNREVTSLTQLSDQQNSHRYPSFLPDGRHFIYYAQGNPEASGVYLSNLDGSDTRRLLAADSGAVYASSGHLLFLRNRTLFAQAFDPVGFVLRGNPVPVAEQIAVDNEDSYALSASATGIVVYRKGVVSGLRQLVWFDRSGKENKKVGEPIAGPLNPSISPDGQRVALFRTLEGNIDIWLLELGRGLLTKLTSDPSNDVFPIWSADGRLIVFSKFLKGVSGLYSKPSSGVGAEKLLLETAQTKNPLDWSSDGRFLLYRTVDPKTGYDLWVLSLKEDRKPYAVVQTVSDERDGQFSPDAKWLAYQSNESGRYEIYVQSFPDPTFKSLISTAGGTQVRWRADGKELFYIALDGRLMAVPIRFSNQGTVEAGAPISLFDTHIGGAVQSNYTQQYMVSLDGERFLMNTVVEDTTQPITIRLNWELDKAK